MRAIAPRDVRYATEHAVLHDEQPHCAMRNRAVVSRQTVRQSGRLRRDDTRNLRSIWRKHFGRMEGFMNRFILAADPQDIPELMCDQHVIKMITEEGQMLSSAIRQHMPNFASQHDAGLFNTSPNSGYSRHPCTRWAADNKANFEWAIDLFFHMSVEYTCRFGTEHGTQTRLGGLLLLAITCDEYGVSFPDGKLTSHPQCFGNLQQACETTEWWPVQAYRTYYRHKQSTFKKPMRWTSQSQPSFMYEVST